ncbi:MAG: DUF1223 domain-containing protein [Cypionkella sp.]|nr:DUF1223 domain-containing protein [Cypionkella sp.]
MRQFASACGIWLCLTAPMMADSESGVVVELYTSQGCSSCPPADAFLADLSAMAGVIPLALHVDYWDYIGWADTFGNPSFTARQKAYAHAAGEKMIYTPQMIVDGALRVEGNQPKAVAEAIRASQDDSNRVGLTLTRRDGAVEIFAAPQAGLPEEMMVQLVRYRARQDVAIERGENEGLNLAYHNIVISWTAIGEWAGDVPLQMNIPVPGEDGVVVIIQAEGPGAIVAAARLK